MTLLIKKYTLETFKATKADNTYIDFGISSLHFAVVICTNFRFASTY